MNEENKANTNTLDEGGFLSRWSRLKNQQNNNEDNSHSAQSESNDQTEIISGQSQYETETESAPILTDADMPAIESLTGESDYSGFLSPGVTEELRKLALRKLFNSDYFHLCDGLDDYDEDFTHFEKLGDIITADMKFQLEEEAKAKLQKEVDVEANTNKQEEAFNADDDVEDDFDDNDFDKNELDESDYEQNDAASTQANKTEQADI